MKVIVISDVHGRDDWKKQVENEADKYVFLGDFFDSYDIPFTDQIQNFHEILEFKEQNPDKVILLVGNHDLHYIDFIHRTSGFQYGNNLSIRNVLFPLYENKILKACHLENGHLFSHAGISRQWCDDFGIDVDDNIADNINELFYKNTFAFAFRKLKVIKLSQEGYDVYGDNIWQTPMWIRPFSLIINGVQGFTQVVGHTPQKEVSFNKNSNIYFCDCQDQSDDFLILNI